MMLRGWQVEEKECTYGVRSTDRMSEDCTSLTGHGINIGNRHVLHHHHQFIGCFQHRLLTLGRLMRIQPPVLLLHPYS